jgi:hypothetical protein
MLSMRHSGKIQILIHLSLVAPMPGARLPPRPPALPSQTFTFNDDTATPMPNGIPSNFIWSNAENAATPPQHVNIQRLTPINQSTAATNAVWQGALKAQNSVWQFYQLTMTRWPNPPNSPGNPGSPDFTFPGGRGHLGI